MTVCPIWKRCISFKASASKVQGMPGGPYYEYQQKVNHEVALDHVKVGHPRDGRVRLLDYTATTH
jgi:hypothetical protein